MILLPIATRHPVEQVVGQTQSSELNRCYSPARDLFQDVCVGTSWKQSHVGD